MATDTRIPPDLLELESHNTSYGGGGVLTHLIFDKSVASIPQKANDLIAAVALVRIGLGNG